MLTAVVREGPDGKPMLLVGLEPENIRRMQTGEPVKVKDDETKLGVNVVIFTGGTVETMMKQLTEAGFSLPEDVEDRR